MPQFIAKLENVPDVNVTSLAANNALVWDGSEWINAPVARTDVANTFTADQTIKADGEDVFVVRNTSDQNLIEADTTNGMFVVRFPGGVPGTDELRIRSGSLEQRLIDGISTNELRVNAGGANVVINNASSGGGLAVTSNAPNPGFAITNTNSQSWLFGMDISGHFRVRDDTVGQNSWTVKKGAPSNAMTLDGSGFLGIGASTPSSKLHLHDGVFLISGNSSTSVRGQCDLTTSWVDSTDATRKARAVFNVFDTAAREAMRMEASGTAPMIGFLGSSAVVQHATTGETTGFTSGVGTGVNDDSTFTGNVGTTAYTISDLVKALKNYGLLAS